MIKKLNNEKFVQRLRNNKRVYEFRYPSFFDHEGWTKHLDQPDKKVYYKKEEGKNFITQYVETIIDAPIMNVLLLSNEGDLHETWIPNIA